MAIAFILVHGKYSSNSSFNHSCVEYLCPICYMSISEQSSYYIDFDYLDYHKMTVQLGESGIIITNSTRFNTADLFTNDS